MNYIKLYGIGKSFTNYAKLVLTENFENVQVLVDFLGSKHMAWPEEFDWSGESWEKKIYRYKYRGDSDFNEFPYELLVKVKLAYEKNELYYFVCVKHPLAWLISYGRSFGHHSPSEDQDWFTKMILYWNKRYTNWRELIESNPTRACIWQYESFLQEFYITLSWVADFYDLQLKGSFNPSNKVKVVGQNATKEQSLMIKKFDPNYYLECKYLDLFSKDDLELYIPLFDKSLLDFLGYDLSAV